MHQIKPTYVYKFKNNNFHIKSQKTFKPAEKNFQGDKLQ